MGHPSSKADIIVDAEGLLDAISSNESVVLPSLAAEEQLLHDTLGEVKTLKNKQQEYAALRQETTQLLVDAVSRLREAAMRVRAGAKLKLGPHNERLVQFNVAPIRRRVRKSVEKPPGGEPGSPPPPPEEPVE